MSAQPILRDCVVHYTPEGFLQKRGGVRRVARELSNAVNSLIPGMVSVPCTDGALNNAIRARASTRARYHLAGSLRLANETLSKGVFPIVHSLYYDGYFFNGPRSVVTVYDMIHERLGIGSAELRMAKALSILRSDRVVAISEHTANDVVAKYPHIARSVDVVPLGISPCYFDLPRFDCAVGQRPYLLYVGARGGYKNFGTLLDAMKASAGLHGLDLVLVGGEHTDPALLDVYSLRRGGSGVVRHAASPSDGSLCALYDCAEALVVTSSYEGFGLPVLEAMARCCPVVSTRRSSLAEIDGGLSVGFECHSPLSCADSILDAISLGSGRRMEMRDHAQRFQWSNAARDYVRIYSELC